MLFKLLGWKVSNRIRKLIKELGIAFENPGQPWKLASVPRLFTVLGV